MCIPDDSKGLEAVEIKECDEHQKFGYKLDKTFLLKVGKICTYPQNLDMIVTRAAFEKYFVHHFPTRPRSYVMGINSPPSFITPVPAFPFLSFACNYLSQLTPLNATVLATSGLGLPTALWPSPNALGQLTFGLGSVKKVVIGTDRLSFLIYWGGKIMPELTVGDHLPTSDVRRLVTKRMCQRYPIFSAASLRIRMRMMMARFVWDLLRKVLFSDAPVK